MTDATAVDITSSNFKLPEGLTDSLYTKLSSPQISDFTAGAGSVAGNGAFDVIMQGLAAQLKNEFDNSRITGSEYTKAYLQLVQMAMQTALQWSLQADNSFWQNQTAQIAAVTGLVGLEKARYEYLAAQYNVETILPLQSQLLQDQHQGALLDNTGKGINNDIASYNLSTVLPAQVALTNSQKLGQDDQNAILAYNLSTVLPGQVALTASQKLGQDDDNAIKVYQLNTMLPAQLLLLNAQKTGQDDQNAILTYQLSYILPEQKTLVHEQAEVQHAQTSEVRLDNDQSVMGLIGTQKQLYQQQITSYKRDAEVKAAKLFTDAWITQKTMDDGLLAPLGFTNNSVNEVLTAIMSNNDFGAPTA